MKKESEWATPCYANKDVSVTLVIIKMLSTRCCVIRQSYRIKDESWLLNSVLINGKSLVYKDFGINFLRGRRPKCKESDIVFWKNAWNMINLLLHTCKFFCRLTYVLKNPLSVFFTFSEFIVKILQTAVTKKFEPRLSK